MAMIDDFRANIIGGGARPNQFKVEINTPPGIATGMDNRRTSFLCKATTLPSSTLGEITMDFRGRQIFVAGDRASPDPWTTTFLNDTDFMIKNMIEKWSNGINDFAENTGVNTSAQYMADLTVHQLDRDDSILKTYQFINAWPTTTGSAITLDMATRDSIEEFECTWRYQHFVTSGAGLPAIVAGLEGA
jgi:hypothetical protein